MTTDPDVLPEFDSIAALLPAFEFEGLIARGTAGPVYKARQRSLDRHVAIRFMPQNEGADPACRNSFEAGVKAMASLTHPSLIRVFDSGDVDGLPYIVMEYVPGKSLHHSAHGKAIEPRQAVQIIIAACQGLAHAHGNGIFHRGLKPADILLTPKCEPKIGNFGYARQNQANAAAYMAPELADGSVSENPQTDVHAIGVMLRELLTGIPAGTVDAEPSAIADPKLAAICDKATHSDPAQRYSDAAALAEALKQWSARGSIIPVARPRYAAPQRPRPVAVPRSKPRAERTLLKNCAVIGFLLFAICGAWGVYKEKQLEFARLQQSNDTKPRIVTVKVETENETWDQFDPMFARMEP
jgi:serine/threonine protein kinase